MLGEIILATWMMLWGSLEPVGTQNLLPGNLLQPLLLHVRCGDFCRRGPASRSPRRCGTGPIHSGGMGESYCFPTPLLFSPGRRVGRNAAQRPRIASQSCAQLSHSVLTPQPVWKTQLCPTHVASSDSHTVAQGPETSQFYPLRSISRVTTSVQGPLTGQW